MLIAVSSTAAVQHYRVDVLKDLTHKFSMVLRPREFGDPSNTIKFSSCFQKPFLELTQGALTY